ncbi:MAG: hypothetical protein ACI4UA_08770, partial [Bacteroidaceae bacterium]
MPKKSVTFGACALCVAALVLFSAPVMADEDVPRVVNFVNFIRACEPRFPDRITPQVLYETVRSEAEALHHYGFHGTWLLQYDALIMPKYQQLMREEAAHGCEVGGWWEITEPHVRAAGIKWRGRYPWDWHSDVGFSVGYTQQERERLVDVYMHEFRNVMGFYPHSVGSWFIDAHTLAYMHDKYGVEGSCMCRDQVGTDGYTLWGGYWHGAYYPSRRNMYMPAQTHAEQIDLPVFRMLGSDPLYQYNAGVGGAVQSVCTMEPTYVNAQDSSWVAWYLRCHTQDPALGYTYFQAGQENSFTWEVFRKGYETQLPQIRRLADEGALRVQTLIESARDFRRKYRVTPPTACSALRDYTSQEGRTVWYDSRYYRANILWQGRHMTVRDLHLFSERAASPYLEQVCTSNQCRYETLPLVDGCLWSTPDEMAGMRLMVRRNQGEWKEATGGEPRLSGAKGRMYVVWPLDDAAGEVRITMAERGMQVTCTARDMEWCLLLTTQPQASLPFDYILGKRIDATLNGFPYYARI